MTVAGEVTGSSGTGQPQTLLDHWQQNLSAQRRPFEHVEAAKRGCFILTGRDAGTPGQSGKAVGADTQCSQIIRQQGRLATRCEVGEHGANRVRIQGLLEGSVETKHNSQVIPVASGTGEAVAHVDAFFEPSMAMSGSGAQLIQRPLATRKVYTPHSFQTMTRTWGAAQSIYFSGHFYSH